MALWHERLPPPEAAQTRPYKKNLTVLPPEGGDNIPVMVRFWRARTATTDAVFAIVAVAVIAAGIVVTSELRFADAAGQPLGVPAVTISPSPVPSAEPGAEPNAEPSAKPSLAPSATATPTSSASSSATPDDDEPGAVPGSLSGDDEPEVVTGPPPVEVELDDHDELRNDDSPDDNPDDSPGDSSSSGSGNSRD